MKVVFDAAEIERAVLRWAQKKLIPRQAGEELVVTINWRRKTADITTKPESQNSTEGIK